MPRIHVKTTGNNTTGDGSEGNPYLTITKGHSVSVPGDTIVVHVGTYNEFPTITRDGSDGNYITYLAEGAVICRGFTLSGANYVNFVGFEITHIDSAFNDAFVFTGTCSHIGIYDNNIHHIRATHSAIACAGGAVPTYVTIRGNIISWTGNVNGIQIHASTACVSAIKLTSHHWVIEYNMTSRCADYFYMNGDHHIGRNNVMLDYEDIAPSVDSHLDGFQNGSDGAPSGTHHLIHEANYMGDMRTVDSHFGIWQDTVLDGDTNIIIRGNVVFHLGSGGIGVINTDLVKTYHNTMHNLAYLSSLGGKGTHTFYSGSADPDDWPHDGCIVNSLLSDLDGGTAIETTETVDFRISNNIGYDVAAHVSYVSTADPLFVDPTAPAWDFRLQAGSAAIGAGTYLATVTSANGSGTFFDVDEPDCFCDGFGIVDGDTITVGAVTTRITNITGNTITVEDSVSWTQDVTRVYWGSDSTPDIGAIPYSSAKLTASTIAHEDDDYTVTPTGTCRGVWFYVDGIPTTWVSEAPFVATIPTGTVTAKAYALYAQDVPVINAVEIEGPPAPLTPASAVSGNVQFSGSVRIGS